MRGVPDDGAISNPERLGRLMGDAGGLRDAQRRRPLLDHVQPESVDLRVSLAEAPVFKEGAGADRTARAVLEEQERFSTEKSFKVSVYGKLCEGH